MKVDFAPVKLNIGLDKVYFFFGKRSFLVQEKGFRFGGSQFGLGWKVNLRKVNLREVNLG